MEEILQVTDLKRVYGKGAGRSLSVPDAWGICRSHGTVGFRQNDAS